ncbi:hypothetical protein H112_07731 [Trichophyton rubrum D6]|uniref:Altered inheritance of mitochondria protein 21 n=4 Tax=Trichophyton TaxID=5550 RepID=A0A178EUG2_TRIRU|nr:uncharacterized protein TERG_00330 [Trichophyton rubrum CBS 118892]EZF11144.1 hypothetical protein H100_07755 [Trichophyton rubrum MR850]EZF38008.1 hypothetical protein H102_07720 [Trichophyton rubrum CBS 100081]EZF48643.1 hypothetical protein H103_07743 [Trichophyton rubrum CBS 288.86]EZF59329.1 hypothetical protein H104_07692 [Trichophyton rubrum CBS 289.86]EZF69897.1 hypothetical protein H105_07747 [Trichophyton soudanense CBS 452.61]EZF80520.1 hypothetical protein H110_07741 [Trichophy
MSTKAPPPIPPRPSRSPNNANANPPKIPPRPTSRPDRNSPPKLDSFAPSPLNAPPSSSLLGADSPIDPSIRPDSATLPPTAPKLVELRNPVTQGEKVAGYGVEQPAETRNVHQDLHLHAPRPSLPTSSATAQVQAVTRTDASHGHETGSEEDVSNQSLYSKSGIPHIQLESSNASASQKSYPIDEGTAALEMGQRVPMYPNAGYVQAPSPSPGSSSPHEHRDSHNRTKSRQEPPGSYGLHGHGVTPDDPFEKSWYQKHPKELALEEQAFHASGVGSPRPDWAMSSEDLNKIVKSSRVTGASDNMMGTPDEELGNIMTEQLASRLQSPPAESSLQHEVLREDSTSHPMPEKQKVLESLDDTHNKKPESHEVKIHVDEPLHHQHHPDGFALAPEPEAKLKEHLPDEEDFPVLASDEIDPSSAALQPAVSPSFENKHHDHIQDTESAQQRELPRPTGSGNKGSESNPRDQGESASMPVKHTKEYEPLFHDDDSERRLSPDQRFKSPVNHTQRFPSKDIWEDAPSSAQLHATVSTPDIPKRPKKDGSEREALFETPEQEQERVREADKMLEKSGLEEPPAHLEESRPEEEGSKQRFPSKDVWEEAPESQQLTAAVEAPADSEKSEKPEKPSLPSLPPRPSRQPDRSSTEEQRDISPTKTQATSPTELKKRPSVPDRPKPQVPQRPTRKKGQESGEPLSKTISGENPDNAAPPAPKSKPALPPRAVGSKIAALKAGFLSDLDSRLKLGPSAPKPKETEKEEERPTEKGPLSDARKGRARGPPRRKPAAKSTPAVAEAEKPQTSEIKLTYPWNVWSIGPDGEVNVPSSQQGKSPSEPNDIQSESPFAPPPTKATVSPPEDPESQAPPPSRIDKAVKSAVFSRAAEAEGDHAPSEVARSPPQPAMEEPISSNQLSSEHLEKPEAPAETETDTRGSGESNAKSEPYSGLKASGEAPNAAGIMDKPKRSSFEEACVPAVEAEVKRTSMAESKGETEDAKPIEKQ